MGKGLDPLHNNVYLTTVPVSDVLSILIDSANPKADSQFNVSRKSHEVEFSLTPSTDHPYRISHHSQQSVYQFRQRR